MEYRWFPDSRSIIAICADGVSWPVLQIDFNHQVQRLSRSEPAFRWLATISHSGTVAWEESNWSGTGLLLVRSQQSKKDYILQDLNPQIKHWDLGFQRVVHWKNSRKEDMEGILIQPANYVEGTRYPLIVDAYPHISNSFKGSPMLGNQSWASKGYVIFFPNARAPHVYENFFKSQNFDQAARGPRGWDVTLDDVTTGVNELIAEHVVDPDRMGLYGFSNGGGIVNYLVTRTNRFKCAVSIAGALADWVRPVFLRTDSPVPRWAGGLTPWSDPEAYVQLSAVFHLDRVTTPMLLADGDEDGEFLLDTIEMYNGLRRLSRSVTLLRYPGQGHGFTGKALKDFAQREDAFFSGCLLGSNQ